jgi:hypothetical protein
MMAPFCFAQNQTITVPAKTTVIFKLNSEISTKISKTGEIIQFTLLKDIVIDDQVVVLKDSPVFGEVVHAQKSGMGGKAGELLLAIRYVESNKQKIPLRSLKPYIGDNKANEAMTLSMIPYAGVFALFIRGKEIIIPAGTEGQALVAKDTVFDLTPQTQETVLPVTNITPPQIEILQ